MRSICRVFALVICLSPALSAYAQTTFTNTPQGLNNAAFWLEADSLSMVRQSRTTESNGTYGFEPCCTGFYNNFYPRDYDYMLQGCPEAFSNTEMENSCMTVVNEGAAGIDGAIDNPLFEVDVAYRTYMNTGDLTLLSKTLNNGSTLVNGLVSLMNGVPRSNGMVYVASGIGYGFQDTVTVTGNDFYCSLLDVQASNQLAALLTATGNTSAAATWTAAAKAETTDIQNTFWNSSDGMFHASTGTCSNNISVWGSAFAVTSGVASASQSSSIANYFNNNYSNLVLAGQIREIPSPTYWASSWEPAGSEQNGGYWGLPEGQFDSVLATVNPTLAKQTLLDYCNFLNTTAPSQLHPGPEWTGSGSVANGARYYCANVTMPLATAKQYMLSAQPTLQSMKGALNSSADIALASKGGVAFAQDQLSSSNSAANVNDGVYGNNSCWIAGNQSSFVGVAFNKAYTISDLAFGRDNSGAYSDRYQGTYIFQYTTIANPNASTPDADWTSFGGFYLDSVYPNTTNNYRHLYNFAPISGVTGVRIEVRLRLVSQQLRVRRRRQPWLRRLQPRERCFPIQRHQCLLHRHRRDGGLRHDARRRQRGRARGHQRPHDRAGELQSDRPDVDPGRVHREWHGGHQRPDDCAGKLQYEPCHLVDDSHRRAGARRRRALACRRGMPVGLRFAAASHAVAGRREIIRGPRRVRAHNRRVPPGQWSDGCGGCGRGVPASSGRSRAFNSSARATLCCRWARTRAFR